MAPPGLTSRVCGPSLPPPRILTLDSGRTTKARPRHSATVSYTMQRYLITAVRMVLAALAISGCTRGSVGPGDGSGGGLYRYDVGGYSGEINNRSGRSGPAGG